MKKIISSLLTICTFVMGGIACHAQTFDTMWNDLEKDIEGDLPRQVVKDAMRIYDKAVKEKNFPQMMKAWISVAEAKCDIDADSFDIKHFPEIKCKTPVENAIYNAILGSAYGVMRHSSTRDYDADGQKDFTAISEDYFDKALADKEALMKEKSTDYVPLVTLGGDSRLYGNDMLSVMVRYVTEQTTRGYDFKIKLLDEVAELYKLQGNREAWTLTTLNCLQYKQDSMGSKSYMSAIKQLLDQSEDLEAGADVAMEYTKLLNNDDDQTLLFIRWAKKQFPKSGLLNFFKTEESLLMQSQCNIKVPSFVYPNLEFNAEVKYKNTTGANIEVRKYTGKDRNHQLRTDGKLVVSHSLTLATDSVCRVRMAQNLPYKGSFTDKFTLPAGHYVVVLKSGEKTSVSELYVTSLQVFLAPESKDECCFMVMDKQTGKPVSGATLHFFDRKDNETKSTTNDDGVCIGAESYKAMYASLDEDDATPKTTYNVYFSDGDIGYKHVLNLYTDRAIYRPGQMLHASGILYDYLGKDELRVRANAKVSLSLLNANAENVGNMTVETNEWGSFNADFTLPKDCLPGNFLLLAEADSVNKLNNVEVEEYKRPTFEVSAEPVDADKEIVMGDSADIKITAKTFSGVPVQGGLVKYTIKYNKFRFGDYFHSNGGDLVDSGEVSLDGDGCAIIKVNTALATNVGPLLDDEDSEYRVAYFNVHADVTDMAGETQSAEYGLRVSNYSFGLSALYRQYIDTSKADDVIKVRAVNLYDKELEIDGTYAVLNTNSDTVYTGRFTTGHPVVIPSLPMGNYKFAFRTTDSKGHDIKAQSFVTLYDSQKAIDPRTKIRGADTAFDTPFETVINSEFSEDQPGEILFSPSDDDVYLFCSIMSNDKVIERKILNIGRHLYRLKVDYRSEYGDAAHLLIAYVKNGERFVKMYTFSYKQPERTLKLTWKTFRDKLVPGQKEEWILTVKDKDGKTVNAAEMMATMYDASLDQLIGHNWFFSASSPRIRRYLPARFLVAATELQLYVSETLKNYNWPERTWDELVQFSYTRFRFGRPMLMKSARAKGVALMESSESADAVSVEDYSSVETALTGRIAGLNNAVRIVDTGEKNESKQYIRSNFAETAFFYPHLVTDLSGDVHISFTLPESLTTWRLMGIVHTKDIRYATIDTTCVTQKMFMVQPNMPRFVREGDKVSIASRVINQSETPLMGEVRMVLVDLETNHIVFKDNKQVSVDAGQTASVEFSFETTDKYPLLVCEITAEAGEYSDGERNYLPVLTAKKYITETMPFYIEDGKQKSVDISTLFNEGSNTATRKNMTLEYTATPAWTVIEALEGIKVPENNDALSFAASLYANAAASRLAQSVPGLRDALVSQQIIADSSSVNSGLATDEELKDIVLRESPWLRDALNEANQRKDLPDLFNEELMKQRTQAAKSKLSELQNGDGSWSWFDGMKGSYYITLAVCENLALLNSSDSEVQQMLEKGMTFVDNEEYRSYVELKKKIKVPNVTNVYYLYVSSLMPERKVSKDISGMREAYLKQLEKEVRNLTVYGRATAAYVLRVFGHTKKADEFLQSVIEYSVTKPGMGRYYATDAAYYSWRDYRIPTQLAAMRAIRQSALTDKRSLIADMQVWLLRQKQTQIWDNPMNTIGAVSFLLENSDGFFTGPVPAFSIDGKPVEATLDTTKFLAKQLGYVKTHIDDALISDGVKELQVVPASNDSQAADGEGRIAWGAVYAGYLEDMDNLKNQSSGELKISRRVLSNGETVDLKKSKLSVGDKVTVRLTITADRDMDFVQVRSQHPACFEPVDQHSGYRWMGGRGGYVAMHDASVDVFFDRFTKGTTTFDIDYYVTREGTYLTGVATVQCAYSPEYAGHTDSEKINVTK